LFERFVPLVVRSELMFLPRLLDSFQASGSIVSSCIVSIAIAHNRLDDLRLQSEVLITCECQ
jgi:hypothetical protein